MAPPSSLGSKSSRVNDTHVFFWGSELSNWDTGCTFSGAEALRFLQHRLDEIEIVRPGESESSTQLILNHRFNCGEQFMMACKAWIFDRDPGCTVLKTILATRRPMDQKALGRKVPGFNDATWTPASIQIVVASLVVRAEANSRLGSWYEYQQGLDKIFVEGSPKDRIWGVGIHWNDTSIEEPRNWRGENRLGKCHGLARDAYRQRKEQKQFEKAQAKVQAVGRNTDRPKAPGV